MTYMSEHVSLERQLFSLKLYYFTLVRQTREWAIDDQLWFPSLVNQTKFRMYRAMDGWETFPLNSVFGSWPNQHNYSLESDDASRRNYSYLQEISNQVDGHTTDLFPRMRGVHEGRILDLLIDVLVLVEGKRTRQTHLIKGQCNSSMLTWYGSWNHTWLT